MPLIIDLAKTDEQKQILRLIFARQVMGRPFLAPPGVPPDRVEALRKAFMDTMKDKDFLADAEKAQLEITPVSGRGGPEAGRRRLPTPPEIAEKAADLLKSSDAYREQCGRQPAGDAAFALGRRR